MSELGPIRPVDTTHIDVAMPAAVQFWCRELGCTEAGLKAAVHKVGSKVEDVRREITGRWK